MQRFRAFSQSSTVRLPRAARAPASEVETDEKTNKGAHHDLTSFLNYAEQSGLSTNSTVFVGTRYEYTVLEALKSLGLTLTRTGGAQDKGIDLRGAWQLPSLPDGYPLRVIVQCKALARKTGPSVIRELEGAFASMPRTLQALDNDLSKRQADEGKAAGSTHQGFDHDMAKYGSPATHALTMGVLVTPLEATKAVREAMARSRLAMGFAKVSHHGIVEQLLWNRAAAERGLGGIGVTVQYTPEPKGQNKHGSAMVEQIKLTWNNQLWPAAT